MKYIFKMHLAMMIFIMVFVIPGCRSQDKKDVPAVKEVLDNFNGETVLPREANNILIPAFGNMTGRDIVSEKLTSRLIEKINLDGRLAVVHDRSRADLLLKGMVTGYELQPLEFGSFGEVSRERLRIIASIKFFDIRKNKEIFYERDIQAFEVFSGIIPPIISESQAQDKVIENLSGRIILQIMNGWYTKLMTPVEKGKR